MGFFDDHGPIGRAVRLAGNVEALSLVPLDNLGPFLDFQAHAVRAGNSRGDEGHALHVSGSSRFHWSGPLGQR